MSNTMDKVKGIFHKNSDSVDSSQSYNARDHADSDTSSRRGSNSSQDTSLSTHENDGGLKGTLQHEVPGLGSHKHTMEKHADPSTGTGAKTHDHKHLAAVTKEGHHHHETEEVAREREHDRHIHHVQHHVQPVKDTVHHDREHTEHSHPVSHVKTQHVNTDEDTQHLAALTAKHKDHQHHHEKERTIVDKGETVHENVHHHVHHVVQPVIERDTHHHNTVHTTIPVKHTTHEAPIIHQSTTHEPMHMKDFLSAGGDLKSKLDHKSAGVLATGECAEQRTGPMDKLMNELHLGSSSSHSHGATGATSEQGVAQ
ncbi:hypothetical protein MNV49_002195 [Pseudohyphozyma bogoriensis]|nr:hypothetical protein MNV49_002195 [Pseudohyphozyma bogoriensis]